MKKKGIAPLEKEVKLLKAYLQTMGVIEVKRRGRKTRSETKSE